jgi:hypothetical protein
MLVVILVVNNDKKDHKTLSDNYKHVLCTNKYVDLQ